MKPQATQPGGGMNQPATLSVNTPTDLEIVMTRSFNAPRQLVWDAMTKPELVRRWLFAPPGWTMTECEGDLRVGGKFRWAWNGPDGKLALVIWGVNREIVPPMKIVHTEVMEMPGMEACGGGGGELLATIELIEQGGKTMMRMTLLFDSKEARDGALASGMEHGMNAGYANLDQMLAEAV